MSAGKEGAGPGYGADGEGFLQRFHRRKLAARRGEVLPQEPPGPMPVEVEETAPPLTDTDMPPVESLTAESDFSGFLSPDVSEELRRTALRRLWQVADVPFVDDLDVYAGDYTAFESLGGLVTREMRHRLALEARRQAEQAVEAVEGPDEEKGLRAGEQADRPDASAGTATGVAETDAQPLSVEQSIASKETNS